MKELPSPVHAERMKMARFGSLERFRTEALVFGSDACEVTDAANESTITGVRHTRSTDQTAMETLPEDGIDMEMTPVEVATQTTNGQGHDVGTESPNEDDDK